MDSGFAILPEVLSDAECDCLSAALNFSSLGSTHDRRGLPYANRQALDDPAVMNIAVRLNELLVDLLPGAFAVRAILFDKVPGANWKVPWHQDLTIAVKERVEAPGYGPWSIKEGIHHVQPPSEVLRHMLALRLHLDDCGPENGPLRVIPGTHRSGRLNQKEVDTLVEAGKPVELTCKKGDLILMSPLLLHASSPAESPNHRRVVHVEYANCELAAPLQWAHRVK